MNHASRLSVATVERLHHTPGGHPMPEAMVLRFIRARWGARNLFYLPMKVAAQAVSRPGDFIRAAKDECGVEVGF